MFLFSSPSGLSLFYCYLALYFQDLSNSLWLVFSSWTFFVSPIGELFLLPCCISESKVMFFLQFFSIPCVSFLLLCPFSIHCGLSLFLCGLSSFEAFLYSLCGLSSFVAFLKSLCVLYSLVAFLYFL